MDYQLQNNQLTVGLTSLGGTITSIKSAEGLEYLWQGDPAYWSGQAPILFPICGSLRDNKASVGNGLWMEMPRHGIVRKREFELYTRKEDEIAFVIQSDQQLQQQFPFPFRLISRYQLQENHLVISYEVENTGRQEMPFHIGAHPGFRCPLLPGEQYTDYYIEFEQEENLVIPKAITGTGLIDMQDRMELPLEQKRISLSHELFDVDSIIMDTLKSRKVSLQSKVNSHRVTVEFPDMPYLILWSSANPAPFVAIEPWVGLSTCTDEDDCFEHKRNIQFVQPGETKRYCHTISVE